MTTPSSPNDPIPNAAYPTAGQGLTLDLNGKLPQAVQQTIPGYQYALDSFTVTVNSTATTEAGATTVKTSTSVIYDGTAVWIEFQCGALSSSVAGGGIWLSFFDGATAIGKVRFGSDAIGVASPGLVRVPFTPSAGAHTFTVKIWATTASTVGAAADVGGTDTVLPGYIRVTRA